jgi:hypothetical protein
MKIEKGQIIYNEYAKMWRHGNILCASYNNGIIVDEQIARDMLETRLAIADGKPHFLYADCRGVKYWTRESRRFTATKEHHQFVIAGSIVYSDLYVVKVLLNFFFKFNKLPFPSKFFTNEQDAIAWLSSMKGYREDL